MTVLVLDAIGCLLAAGIVRVAQVWFDESWREQW